MLIERDQDLELCRAAVTRLRGGQGGILAVAGGLGVGRSALLRRAADLAAEGGVPVVPAAANRAEQDLPRSLASRLWREIRGSAAARTGTLLVTIDDLQWADDASLAWLTRLDRQAGRAGGVAVLVVLAVLDGDAAGDRPGVRAALARADRTLRPAPLSPAGVERLLVSMADAASANGTAGANGTGGPNGAARADGAAGKHGVAGNHGVGVDRAAAARLHRLTGGNPLLVRSLAANPAGWAPPPGRTPPTGSTPPTGTTPPAGATPPAAWTPPAGWEAAAGSETPDVTGREYEPLRRRVAAAVTALPTAQCAFLLHGVLLGADAEPGLVGRLAGLDDIDARTAARALRAMGLHGSAEPQPLLDAVVRHVVGTTICPESFAVGHVQAAEALYRAGAPAERIAAHLEQVVVLQPYAAGVLSDAAAAALARHDVASAVRYLRLALRGLPPDGAERAGVLVELAVAERCGNPSTLVRRVLQALPALPGDDARAAALARIPPMALLSGAEAAGEAIDGVLRHLAPEPPERPVTPPPTAPAERPGEPPKLPNPQRPREPTESAQSAGHRQYTSHPQQQGEPATTGPGRDEPARVAARPAGVEALAQRLEARRWLAGWQDPAVLAAATARLRDGMMRPRTPAERELAAVLLFCATMSAELSAQELAPLAQLLFEALPVDHDTLASIAPLLVASAVAVERVPALRPWLAEASRVSDAAPCRRVAAQVHAQLAFQQLHTGQPGAAAASAANALTVLPDGLGDDAVGAAMLFAVAAAVPDDRLRQRTAALWRPERATAETGMLPMVRNLLYGAMLYNSEPQAALVALTECQQQLATHGWRNRALFPTGTMIAPLLDRLGRAEEAVECIAEEHRLVAAWGAPAATGRTLRVWGELSHGRQSLRLLDDAVDVLEHSANELELARALLARGTRLLASGRRGAGEDLRRGGQLAVAAGLSWLMEPATTALEAHHEQLVPGISSFTPGERTVTDLVTAGLTNHAIATRLGISQRAVEKHLTNCYRKLGVTNRSALKAVLNRVAGKMSDPPAE
ncbi:helix-turn-helix transcriptional regulator [Dactylosporangium sp. CA-152071]|uniref:helix-turn-helix transcriptional regulator n=1 Tax=Dactylosporangium sp. CA-152071 TaxID=3239933 RepID=UPI003D8CE251